MDEIYSSPPRNNYPTNKTIIKSIDDTWSSDLLDMNDYGIKKNNGYRYILVLIDNFSKFGWRIPLKNKYAQSKTDAFSQIIKTSRHKSSLLKTDDGKENDIKFFNEILYNQSIKKYSRNTAIGAVFAERFIRTIRNFQKKVRVLKKEMLIGYLNYPLLLRIIKTQFTIVINLLPFRLPENQTKN